MIKQYSKYIGLAGIVCLIAGGINYSMKDFMDTLSTVLLYGGAILTLVGAVLNYQNLMVFSQRRDTRYGSNTLVVVVLATIVVGLVNFIGTRHNKRLDTTESGQYSLSPQTISVLQKLQKEVKVTGFFKSGTPQRTEMGDLLDEYRYHAPKLEVTFTDPDKEPDKAKDYEITAYNTTILECGEMKETLTTQSEQDLSNALVRVTRERKKIIYFTEGHNERDIDGTDADAISSLKEALTKLNYEVRKVLLAREKAVPADCEVLVVAGPKVELFQAELDTINDWLSRDGQALFLVDPDPSPGFVEFFKRWDVAVGEDVVVDLSGIGQLFGAGPAMPLVSQYKEHDIVKDLSGVATFFPMTRSVRTVDTPTGGTEVTSLFETTPQSFGETELMSGGTQVRYDPDKDLKGPVSLAVAVMRARDAGGQNKGDGGKLVVVGDSDFASNRYFGMQANGDLALNIVNWLAEESDLVAVGPKNREDRRVNLTATQTDMFFWLSIIGMPGIVVLGGVLVYFRRRSH